MVLRKSLVIVVTVLLLVLCGVCIASCTGGGSSSSPGSSARGSLPRNETFYLNGMLWGAVTQWNPYSTGGMTFGISLNSSLARQLIYETLFLYNLLDGKLYPHLGDSYTWEGQTLTIALDRNVKFSDGTPMTAADVVNSYMLQKNYQTLYSGYWSYIESVSALDDHTVVIKANPNNWNPKLVEVTLAALYITPKHVWDKITAEAGTDRMAVARYTNQNPIATGPYKPLTWDETKAVLQRVDTYWGKDSPKFGKLPAPKYVAHNVYKDNATGDAAFRAGEVDMSQQFIASVWTFPKEVETFISKPPYYFPGAIPMLVFNTKRPGLDDPVVRRAIGMSLDYETIGQNAMSGYTAKMVPSLMLPVPAEQVLIDAEALKPYQWNGVLQEAIAAANKLLDDAGWIKGADGIRAKGAVRLSFQAECPTGWSDWNATLEVVAQAGQKIGIDIKTYFPQQTVWQSDKDNGSFDIIMNAYGGPGPASPWNRAYQAMGSKDIPPEGTPNNIQNLGRWMNDEVNGILAQITVENDAAKLKQLWTRLNIIYLQEMPVAGLMYRPALFHTTNNTVWTGFPKLNDGSNIPPTLCTDGYGIKGLYNLKAR
ncbi:MAG: ABC transporter substrate-binding protein [Treponema sp.]|nr:ABC transporter substrate-binding protein [Treponema sp.]